MDQEAGAAATRAGAEHEAVLENRKGDLGVPALPPPPPPLVSCLSLEAGSWWEAQILV